jgi:hypothetical protein
MGASDREQLVRSAVRNQLQPARDDRYKWVALANTTAAMFMATLGRTYPRANMGVV